LMNAAMPAFADADADAARLARAGDQSTSYAALPMVSRHRARRRQEPVFMVSIQFAARALWRPGAWRERAAAPGVQVVDGGLSPRNRVLRPRPRIRQRPRRCSLARRRRSCCAASVKYATTKTPSNACCAVVHGLPRIRQRPRRCSLARRRRSCEGCVSKLVTLTLSS
jgi:hypothetical protein